MLSQIAVFAWRKSLFCTYAVLFKRIDVTFFLTMKKFTHLWFNLPCIYMLWWHLLTNPYIHDEIIVSIFGNVTLVCFP